MRNESLADQLEAFDAAQAEYKLMAQVDQDAYNAAIDDAIKVAESYDFDDPYCNGAEMATQDIAAAIKKLRKVDKALAGVRTKQENKDGK